MGETTQQERDEVRDSRTEFRYRLSQRIIRDADRLAEAEALLRRIDQRGHVGDQDHEDIQRLLSGGG